MLEENQNRQNKTFGKRFKNKLFYLFHNLLLYKDISPTLAAILTYLNFSQLLLFTLNRHNPHVKAYFLGDIVKNIDVIQIYPIVIDFGYSTRLVLAIIVLAIMTLTVISMVTFSFIANYKKSITTQKMAYLMGFFYEFISKLLFVPLLGSLVSIMKCPSEVVSCFSGKRICLN